MTSLFFEEDQRYVPGHPYLPPDHEGMARAASLYHRRCCLTWEGMKVRRVGRQRAAPWGKHSRIRSWAPDEAAHSPTRQRCDQVDLASSAPPGGSWPGGGAGSDLERVRSR